MCAYHCVQLSFTTQHRTVLKIFPLILQTIIIAQMVSTGGVEVSNNVNRMTTFPDKAQIARFSSNIRQQQKQANGA